MSKELRTRYQELLDGLLYAVHEFPSGVLYGSYGANAKQFVKLLSDLNEFEARCQELGYHQFEFVKDCRWHFDHNPHYLGRRTHFASYAQYVEGRKSPLTVRRLPV